MTDKTENTVTKPPLRPAKPGDLVIRAPRPAPGSTPLSRVPGRPSGPRNKTRKKQSIFTRINWTALWNSVTALFDFSFFFRHCPAIAAGIIIGLLIINWIEGLNDGAKLLVFVLSICACEIVYQLLKKPQIVAGVLFGLIAITWIDGLNNGAKLIVIFVAIGLSDFVYQAIRKAKKTGAWVP